MPAKTSHPEASTVRDPRDPRDVALDGVEAAFALMARKAGLPRVHERLSAMVGVALDQSSFQLIRRLDDSGPIRASDLSVLMGLDLSTVSRQVANLETLGLLVRAPDPQDGRASLLTLSEQGRLASSRICEARRGMFAEMLVGWPDRDLERFAELLTRFAHAMASLAEPHRTEPHGASGAPRDPHETRTTDRTRSPNE